MRPSFCIINDDKNKWGRFIDGARFVGGRDEMLLSVEKYEIEKIRYPKRDARELQRYLGYL